MQSRGDISLVWIERGDLPKREKEFWLRQLNPEESQEIQIFACLGKGVTNNKKYNSISILLTNPFFSDFDFLNMN